MPFLPFLTGLPFAWSSLSCSTYSHRTKPSGGTLLGPLMTRILIVLWWNYLTSRHNAFVPYWIHAQCLKHGARFLLGDFLGGDLISLSVVETCATLGKFVQPQDIHIVHSVFSPILLRISRDSDIREHRPFSVLFWDQWIVLTGRYLLFQRILDIKGELHMLFQMEQHMSI